MEQGEPIALAGTFPLIAPLSGLLENDSSLHVLRLQTEGSIRIGKQQSVPSSPSFSNLEMFIQSLEKSGIPSLDFPGVSLSSMVRSAFAGSDTSVILSVADRDGSIDWQSVFASREGEIKSLCGILSGLKPGVRIVRDGWSRLKRRARTEDAGKNHPWVIASRLSRSISLHPGETPDKQGVLFIGPATLFALIDFLFYEIPFYSRLVALRPEKSRMKKRSGGMLVRFANGTALEDIADEIQGNLKESGIFAGSIFRPVEKMADSSLNIFQDSTIYFLKNKKQAGPLPCTGCRQCDAVCPVDAAPFALILGHPAVFKKEFCLDCGICASVCPAFIDLNAAVSSRETRLG